jgi:cytochrome c-type biogenesis protein
MLGEVSLTVAFLGGLLTFLSPCVLPLLPAYLAYFSGTGSGDERHARVTTLVNAFAFTLGFSAAFVLIGAIFL